MLPGSLAVWAGQERTTRFSIGRSFPTIGQSTFRPSVHPHPLALVLKLFAVADFLTGAFSPSPIDNHPPPSVKMAKEATARSGLIVGINKGHVR